ncbi:MAG TPA: UDP-N-acetylmuramoyl-L-alanine--D-glutamate ligase [Syntrophales bacterium]|nr:UDP-N-acetylmuramoyl-L-alanine--D-glutamate ligase [Syntrophales bacterium]
MVMELMGRKVLVVGLGKTGVAAARFLMERGALAVLTDERPVTRLGEALGELACRCELKPHAPESLAGVDLVVPSPGVPPTNAILAAAAERGIPVLSEVELAFRFLRNPMIAVTGTNGKTTTVTLLGQVLAGSGKRVFVGGNIGDPLIGYVNGPQEEDLVVVEVSSFQLLYTELFRPRVAVLLNTTPDHIDYHGSFCEYRAAKERIFMNQESGDLAVLNADEPSSRGLAGRVRADVRFFSSKTKTTPGMFLDGRVLRLVGAGEEESYPVDMVRVSGVHNIENVMAVIIAARFCGVSREAVVRTVGEFKGISHRIEFAGEKRGVAFYDDSKGTNVGAVRRALESFDRPTILLLGGRDKGGDFESLSNLMKERVKEVVIFGEAREAIHRKVGGCTKVYIASTLREAVKVAYSHAVRGDVVLLSPGCSSFDEFSDYAERGRVFQEVVKEL